MWESFALASMNAMLVMGTRPEAIKLAPVYHAFKASTANVRVCVTAQHRFMLDQVLRLFEIHPDRDLDLMRVDQDLFKLTASTIQAVGAMLEEEKPDVVVVQGDTTTAMATTIAAFYARVPVAHVEAGLRTGDRSEPFPEEANRRICDVLADFLFAPTEWAKSNLVKEGHAPDQVHVTGNTQIDALLYVDQRVRGLLEPPGEPEGVTKAVKAAVGESERLLLVTGHRRESFDEGIAQIARALGDIVAANPGVSVIYPVHLNPNVQQPVHSILGGVPRVHLVPPLAYGAFVWLMQHAYMILTDSGGIQEEAPALGKPTLVLRNKTERPEGLEAGTSKLVGTRREEIVAATQELLDNDGIYRSMSQASNPYGDGRAAERIVSLLCSALDARVS